MTRDLVERARRGDHDAFAELAGAAISRLDAAAWLMLRDADVAMDAVQIQGGRLKVRHEAFPSFDAGTISLKF